MQLDSIVEVDENFEYSADDKAYIENLSKTAIQKHKAVVDIIQAKKAIELAQEEWDNLSTTCTNSTAAQTDIITCDEAIEHFRKIEMKQFLKDIKPVKHRKGLEAFKFWVAGPPKLNRNLISERDLFFGIALCPFDSADQVHLRVLQTLYKILSGTQIDCPRYGRHWEDIGFQGLDPGTDLRGVGFLGLLHLLSLVQNPAYQDLAMQIYLLSRHEKQNFPFCTMGINITRIILESMREEALNRECNRKMEIFEVTNDFYTGVFLQLFLIWKQQNKTIMDSGYVIRDLSARAKKNSYVIFRDLSNYLKAK